MVVRQPDYLTRSPRVVGRATSRTGSAWARWRLIHARAACSPTIWSPRTSTFYGRTLSGTEQIRDRWKRGESLVQDLLGEAVGKLYVERHFPPEAKARMDELVANLREAYRVSINALEWMTPETRAKALAKLDKFTPKIGYPGAWRDYSKLVSSATTCTATTVVATPSAPTAN